MDDQRPAPLLGADEPPPVGIERPEAASPVFLSCDHAGRRIPRALGTLGLGEADLGRHIAWDIGALAVARGLSARLDAALAHQRYSRLVIDCNRSPHVASAIPTLCDGTAIPGNRDLAPARRAAREREIFAPYHEAIGRALDRRRAAGRPTMFVAMHSFTPVFGGGPRRPWDVGVLFNRDRRAGEALIALLRAETGLCVGVNQPYAVDDASDYGIPVHGERRGLPHVEIEIRQDLVGGPAGQDRWAALLADLLPRVARRVGVAA